ncbi:MAG: outer membrane beta-barrel protein [Flavisolibacter sp.]
MKKIIALFVLNIMIIQVQAQNASELRVKVVNAQQQPIENATVELVNAATATLMKIQLTDSTGEAVFEKLEQDEYYLRISHSGYRGDSTDRVMPGAPLAAIVLQANTGNIEAVTVTARKSYLKMEAGKTIVNLDALVSNAGTTALEALEKMPGVLVDKDGNISFKGRQGVLVLIDGKPTQLDNAQLASLLGGMSSSQINEVELMQQPPARYDAAGNAGVINIKMKKNLQRGFNGSITSAYTQGVYSKTNHAFQLNYRNGKWNLFANYSNNIGEQFMKIYAHRTYFDIDGAAINILEQQGNFKGRRNVHNVRTGADFALSSKTSVGLTLSGLLLKRHGTSYNPAMWMSPLLQVDSLITTESRNNSEWTNTGANLNFRHTISSGKELSADFDIIGYNMEGEQYFENTVTAINSYTEANRATLPSTIKIGSAKADYSEQYKNVKWETGIKFSRVSTDNMADYLYRKSGDWEQDYGKTNHFLYNENIQALYASAETSIKKWKWQAGLRYEATQYDGQQLGNAVQKDSSFSRSYSSIFPTLQASFEADSVNSFSFSAGRRIDRPPFQKLNPFVLIINKYTYQQGNPYFKPQFTWNFELSHAYKNVLMTSLGYSITTDYFSQIFPIDTSGLVIYTEGNLGKLQHFTFTVGTQLSPTRWWSFSGQAVVVHKEMEGVIGKQLSSSITQLQANLNNQFRFGNGWSGEISGFYVSRSQNDIQEWVDPAGQLTAGIAKSVLKNKGTIKLSVRDIFYTQWMKGNTYFPQAHEYFKLTGDSRVGTISFNWRFGKVFKTTKRSQGSANEEIERVGNG